MNRLTARLAAAVAAIPGTTRTPSGLLLAPAPIRYAAQGIVYGGTATALAALVTFGPSLLTAGLGL